MVSYGTRMNLNIALGEIDLHARFILSNIVASYSILFLSSLMLLSGQRAIILLFY
ncbi:hypothetical protein FHS86_001711 [Roseimarinus sediminis]